MENDGACDIEYSSAQRIWKKINNEIYSTLCSYKIWEIIVPEPQKIKGHVTRVAFKKGSKGKKFTDLSEW